MDTAGRSVLFAGSTVVVALLGMVLLGISFLNGPAIAAALAVLLTMVGSLTLLPALLGAFGRRVKVPAVADGEHESPRWARFSALIERRPRAFAVAATVLLLVVALPVTGMRLGSSDAGSDTRVVDHAQGLRPALAGVRLRLQRPVPRRGRGQRRRRPSRSSTASRPSCAPSPASAAVAAPTYNRAGDTATMTRLPASKPQDAATKDLLERLRADVVPAVTAAGCSVSIGGATAATVDLGERPRPPSCRCSSRVVVGLSLLLLAVVFRSLVIPAKAAVMNLLSIGAALGVVTFVFQNGHLGSLIGVDSTGPIEPFIPVFMFAIVFGLSMDYEVFLVTRMHEEWERTKDASFAVRHGLALTGKVITAAAIIMISVFAVVHARRRPRDQAVRPRPGLRRPLRRVRDPARARPGAHAPVRPRELVDARRALPTAPRLSIEGPEPRPQEG